MRRWSRAFSYCRTSARARKSWKPAHHPRISMQPSSETSPEQADSITGCRHLTPTAVHSHCCTLRAISQRDRKHTREGISTTDEEAHTRMKNEHHRARHPSCEMQRQLHLLVDVAVVAAVVVHEIFVQGGLLPVHAPVGLGLVQHRHLNPQKDAATIHCLRCCLQVNHCDGWRCLEAVSVGSLWR